MFVVPASVTSASASALPERARNVILAPPSAIWDGAPPSSGTRQPLPSVSSATIALTANTADFTVAGNVKPAAAACEIVQTCAVEPFDDSSVVAVWSCRIELAGALQERV